MSGFSTQWLALREPADHRARNAQIRASAVVPFANRDHISIADLACGTGSNLRGLAAHLPARQTWRLVDNDPHLLAAARDTLIAWADSWKDNDPLILLKDGRHIEVVFAQVDLAANPGVALESPLDLVTSAAFFDLVSEAWIETFCAELSRRALPIYTILTYSGEAVWQPPHAIDAAILSAFHQHQGQDKGFGCAAGPGGVAFLQKSLEMHGYRVALGPSPWRLTRREDPLVQALADGIAGAVAETALLPASAVAAWREARRAATGCEIGHIDLWAVPLSGRNGASCRETTS